MTTIKQDSNIMANKRKFIEYDENVRKKINIEIDNVKVCEDLPKILPILGDEYFRDVETEKMFVGKINMKKETSRLIKELSSIWPIGSHLKRVRWTPQKDIFEILIRPVQNNEPSQNYSLASVVEQSKINTNGLMDTVTICDVPKYPVLTHCQYKEAKEYWPVQFREDKRYNKIVEFIKLSLNIAQFGDVEVGCIIVDPATSKVIAAAHDQRDSHPIQHAVMVAVDLVARSQGGGSWDIKSKHAHHKPFSKEEMDSKIDKIKKLNPDKDAKKMCLPYLCTGYDAYISREPCIMCSMALVHSRIRRVFYNHKSSRGALKSHCKLHLQESLNHHYEVFRVELQQSTANGIISKIIDSNKSDLNESS
ncbi:probable inactive tRNA-specific adenosine deaminase-like protein 3 [Caerostris extrusa]|uniref:Probable inactive tRNA-specific adenosine deaminase-like protein 3 n=1 Tax=Caerostris extrusa TaxID=172846 RepID=A0AAV4SWA0_CAEEX|nr:probable inactive tRNA-specific adenosine deaminase-like protein 3 [Caerostris extrusa]